MLLPAHVGTPEGRKVVDLAPKDPPYFLHMPVWNRPRPLASDFAIVGFWRC